MATPAYVPILKGKEGEFAALETLGDDPRAQIPPFHMITVTTGPHAQLRSTSLTFPTDFVVAGESFPSISMCHGPATVKAVPLLLTLHFAAAMRAVFRLCR